MNGVVFPSMVTLRLWEDRFVDRVGFPVRGRIWSWFGCLWWGPSAAWTLRCLHGWASLSPEGIEVPLSELAEAIGLSTVAESASSPMQRTLARLVRFGLAEWTGVLRVRATVPPMAQRQLARLSPRVRRNHDRLVAARGAMVQARGA